MPKARRIRRDGMRLVSWNVNGLRAAIRKGIDGWIDTLGADVLMLQETRVLEEQLPKDWSWPEGHAVYLHPAEKKGYSGVATLSTLEQDVLPGFAWGEDATDIEGRVLVTRHGDLVCVNTYLPNGGGGPERQAYKERWMDAWRAWLAPWLDADHPVVVVGDLNIAHTEDDIWNPKGNAKTSGFLPQERAWFSELLADGWVDSFRHVKGEGEKIYSWWSNRGNARADDKGWRIDYLLCNPAAAKRIVAVDIVRQAGLEVSDHAPCILDLAD